MAEKDSGVAQAEAELAVAQAKLEVAQAKLEVAQAKLEVAEAKAKLLLAKSKEGSPETKELIAIEKTMEDATEEYKLVCKNGKYELEYLLSDLCDIINSRGREFVIKKKSYQAREAFFKFMKSLNLDFNEDKLVLQQVEDCLRTRIRYEQEETPVEKARIELDKKNYRSVN